MWGRLGRWSPALVIGLFAVLQLVPYGRAHDDPPPVAEPAWDSPRTRELAVRACYDCHSNQTTWPWYSNVAPVSWLIQRDVDEGRRRLNFSAWGAQRQEANRAALQVQRGEMPPSYYLLLHPEARLSDQETQALVQGLRNTFGSAPEQPGRRASGREERVS